MSGLLLRVDAARQEEAARLDPQQQAELGQYMTPGVTARFLASLVPAHGGHARLLDAGAGVGSLCAAFAERWPGTVDVTAVELDPRLAARLREHVGAVPGARVVEADFVAWGVERALRGEGGFSHAVLNPPYRKLAASSPARRRLESVGIEAPNLYAAFVALALALLRPGGQLVAILPRSFCNGPYYRAFRERLLDTAALRHIHLFGARDRAFRGDGVLQENVVVRLEASGVQGPVTVSRSTDETLSDFTQAVAPFAQVVLPGDPARFVRIPGPGGDGLLHAPGAQRTLAEQGLNVSTGPVMDFRAGEHLRPPGDGAAALLHPAHFRGGRLRWPLHGKKPEGIARGPATERMLYPDGFYTVVRRFSSKEEHRRIHAAVVDPALLPPGGIGFENHLNVIHHGRQPLPPHLARGLAAYLNSAPVDRHFRQFSGHTQVNAGDLRQLRCPDIAGLEALGRCADPAELALRVEALLGAAPTPPVP